MWGVPPPRPLPVQGLVTNSTWHKQNTESASLYFLHLGIGFLSCDTVAQHHIPAHHGLCARCILQWWGGECMSHSRLVSYLTIAFTRTSGARHSMLITTIRILACGLRRGWGYEAPHDGVIQLCFSRHDSGRNLDQPTNGRSQERSTYSVWWKVEQSFWLISLKGTSFQSAPARQIGKYFTTLADTWALSGHPPHYKGWVTKNISALSKSRNGLTPPPSVQVRTRDQKHFSTYQILISPKSVLSSGQIFTRRWEAGLINSQIVVQGTSLRE